MRPNTKPVLKAFYLQFYTDGFFCDYNGPIVNPQRFSECTSELENNLKINAMPAQSPDLCHDRIQHSI